MDLRLGDSLEEMRKLPDNSVDLILTDPPYGILNHKIEKDINIMRFFEECYRVLKVDSFIIYFGRQPTFTYWNVEAFKLFSYKNEIVWYKRTSSSPMQDMARVFENIMVLTKGKRKFNNVKRPFHDIQETLAEYISVGTFKRYQSTINEIANNINKIRNIIAIETTGNQYILNSTNIVNDHASVSANIKGIPRYYSGWRTVTEGYKATNLVSFMPHNKQKYDSTGQGLGRHNVKHPTVKPVQLIEYLLALCNKGNDVILDPFMGSGTTGIACKQLNRKFIGMEIDKEYFQIAKERINNAQHAK